MEKKPVNSSMQTTLRNKFPSSYTILYGSEGWSGLLVRLWLLNDPFLETVYRT